MNNTFNLPLPKDPLQCVERFARDLAWGAVTGEWSANFIVVRYGMGTMSWYDPLVPYIEGVWNDDPPDLYLLESLGYVDKVGDEAWQLTRNAFELLKQPSPISIFISYRRHVSSALAMLIWSELRVDGFTPFLDIRGLELGDEWHAVLERQVKSSSIFIIIVGPETLESPYIQSELQWAFETEDLRIIPILHGGVTPDDLKNSLVPNLAEKHLITIQNDVSAHIHNALDQLRSLLGVLR